MEVNLGEHARKSSPVRLVLWATGRDKLKAKSHLKKDTVVVRAIISGIHPPAGDSHRRFQVRVTSI